ncbi:hypothetical protein G9A89_018786 [Geosiphon pyriformis]|nr:hypothetical protein G9A89_018786 [Geosiphon pyriformis]
MLFLACKFHFEVSFEVVFKFVGVDRLLVAVVDILLVAMADKLEFDILVVDRLAAASLADKFLWKHPSNPLDLIWAVVVAVEMAAAKVVLVVAKFATVESVQLVADQ